MTSDRRDRSPEQHTAVLLAMRLFFILLICGDLAFIGIHLGHLGTPWLRGPHYSLETDGGLAEFYQYMKQFWIVLCMVTVFLQRRQAPYLCWAGLFGFLLIDDAVQLHERAGYIIGKRLGLPAWFGLRPDDFGELLVAGLVAGTLVAALAVTLWRERGPALRISRDLFLLTVALGACGVVLDMIHVIAYFRVPAVSTLLALLEDGGEMLIVSALTAYAFHIVLSGGQSRLNLWRLLTGQSRRSDDDEGPSADRRARPRSAEGEASASESAI
jgi:hypothetical protein